MFSTRSFNPSRAVNGSTGARSLGKPAPSYPASIATDAHLAIAVDRLQVRLAGAVTSGATQIQVDSASGIVANMLLSIDDEIVQVTAAPAGTTVPVSRGFDGTTAASHLTGALVSGFIDAWHHNTLVSEIQAIEQSLGTNLGNVGGSPFFLNTAHDFLPQTPGGSLTVGSNVLTLAPVPQGVNGADQKHYLYIDSGTGTPEAVLITGGTAVSGAASGTLFITCANTHSGAWRIQSATGGIQEAAIQARAAGGGIVYVRGIVTVRATISVPTGVTITGAGSGLSSGPNPAAQINFTPLNLTLFECFGDHFAISNMKLQQQGTAVAGNVAIYTLQGDATHLAGSPYLQKLEIEYFYNAVIIDGSALCYVNNISAYKTVSDAFISRGAQGFWSDLVVTAAGGSSFVLASPTLAATVGPMMSGLHSFASKGWGIYSTTGIMLGGTPSFLNNESLGNVYLKGNGSSDNGFMSDVVMQWAGSNPIFPATNVLTAPAIKIDPATTGFFAFSNLSIYGSNGSCIVVGVGGNRFTDLRIVGPGQGAQAGSMYAIDDNASFNSYTSSLIDGPCRFSGGGTGTQILGNLLSMTSSLPALNFTAGVNYTVESNFINQAGSGTAITAAGGVTFLTPFENNVFAGSLSISTGVIQRGLLWSSQNFIGAETGANNAIAGFLPVPVTDGLRVIIRLAHSLQAGANTFAYSGGAALPIRSSRNPAANIAAGYAVNGFVTLLYDGSAPQWLDQNQ
jgi:hypothetical protein